MTVRALSTRTVSLPSFQIRYCPRVRHVVTEIPIQCCVGEPVSLLLEISTVEGVMIKILPVNVSVGLRFRPRRAL